MLFHVVFLTVAVRWVDIRIARLLAWLQDSAVGLGLPQPNIFDARVVGDAAIGSLYFSLLWNHFF